MRRFVVTDTDLSVEWYRSAPSAAFVFGDNYAGWGKRGQAVIRDEPNAFGVPTKKHPSMGAQSFFTDDEYAMNCANIDIAIASIPEGATVYVPRRIGMGLACLDTYAPRTLAYLQRSLGIMESIKESKNEN